MVLLSSPDPSGPAGGDETDLPTGRGSSFDPGSLADIEVTLKVEQYFPEIKDY